MSTENQTCLIIGASHAGAQLAVNTRKEGWQGPIIVLGDETNAPYPASLKLLNVVSKHSASDIAASKQT